MKEYLAPEIEKIEYDVEDCLLGSKNVQSETENIGEYIKDLF